MARLSCPWSACHLLVRPCADMQVNKLRNADLFGGGDQEYADEDEDDEL
jgi:hypothetical protein